MRCVAAAERLVMMVGEQQPAERYGAKGVAVVTWQGQIVSCWDFQICMICTCPPVDNIVEGSGVYNVACNVLFEKGLLHVTTVSSKTRFPHPLVICITELV